MTVRAAIAEAAAALAATSDTARLDAELLMAGVLGVSRSELLLRHLDRVVPPAFADSVERRMRHEPVAYILGHTEFYGRMFEVSPAVLIPRADSETVVVAALEACPSPRQVLDCGVGSGALLLTVLAECPGAHGIGMDRSYPAIEIAARNALALHLDCEFVRRDWHEPGWASDLGRFDLVIANPPYVEEGAALDPDVREYEPASALFAGLDGLDDYRSLVPQLPALLEPEGVAVIEIGHEQADPVAAIAAAAGFAIELRRDLGGRPRALILRQN
ncbi:peptide chain release factor N(5)-glutamine methyltransferase [Tsuneonella sp. HG094]